MKSKHTKGLLSLNQYGKITKENGHNLVISGVSLTGNEDGSEENANRDILLEAFNVTNETGMTPRELQKSHQELLDALNKIKYLHSKHYKFHRIGNGFIEEADEVIEQAIDNATKK